MTTGITPLNNILSLVDKMRDQIATALPRHITPERMIRITRTALQKNSQLAACEPRSILEAVVTASVLGLEPNTPLGHCYIIPYGKLAQLQIGYRGLVDLAYRSGALRNPPYAEIVYSNDKFVYELGLKRKLRHVPANGPRGEMVYVYAVAQMKGGDPHFVVLSRAEIEDLKRRCVKASGAGTPWTEWEPEMWKKTAIKRLCKLLPLSIEFRRAEILDSQAEAGEPQELEPIDADWSEVRSEPQRAESLRRRLARAKEELPQPEHEQKPQDAHVEPESDQAEQAD